MTPEQAKRDVAELNERIAVSEKEFWDNYNAAADAERETLAAKANKLLDAVLNPPPEPTFAEKYAKKIGFNPSKEKLAALRRENAILELSDRQEKIYDSNGVRREQQRQGEAFVAAIEAGREPDPPRSNAEIAAAGYVGCELVTTVKNNTRQRMREHAAEIAQSLAVQMRKDADEIDGGHRSQSAEFEVDHLGSPLAEHLRREADAVEHAAKTGHNLRLMLPWLDL